MPFFMIGFSIVMMLALGLTTIAQASGRRYYIAVMCGVGVLGWILVLYFNLTMLAKLAGQ
jgi:mannose/fructose/N-acetylgalactosamine-specific phosphotransferase system component IIC